MLELALIFEPRVLQQIRCRSTLINWLGQSWLQEIDGFFTNGFEVWFLVVDFCIYYHALHFLLTLSWIWVATCKQHVRYYANTPYIDFFIIGHFYLFVFTDSNNLRSHVKRTSKNEIKAFIRIEKAGKTKISNFDVQIIYIFWLEQNVLRLEISMSYVLTVHVVDGEEHLVDNVGSFWLAELLNLNDSIK